MSTKLIDNKKYSLTRYYGGKKKGTMYQITQAYSKPLVDEWCHKYGYVQLSRTDVLDIFSAIVHSETWGGINKDE